MKSRKTEDTLVLLGGALLGAAAMYVMDPEAGQRRRRQIAAAAGSACSAASDISAGYSKEAASQTRGFASRAAGQGRAAGESAADYARRLAEEARELASHLTERASGYLPGSAGQAVEAGRRWSSKWFGQAGSAARDYADDAGDEAHEHLSHLQNLGGRLWTRAKDFFTGVPEAASEQTKNLRESLADRTDVWRKRAAQGVSKASHRAQSWLGHEEYEGHGTGAVLSTAVGCVAIGAATMYFFDPDRGRARRAVCMSRSSAIVRKTGRNMRGIGKDIGNRIRGLAHQAGSLAPGEMGESRINSRQLVDRIRARVGHLSPRVHLVQFMADADGTVICTGEISRAEVDGLLTLLHEIPGVRHVVNRMSVSESSSLGSESAYR